MAKKNKRHTPSFFFQRRQQYGDNWLNNMNAQDVQKNALRVFKDIAFGNISPDTDYKYFNEPHLTYNLSVSAQSNSFYNHASWIGLNSSPMLKAMPDLTKVAAAHWENYQAFTQLYVGLNSILNDIYMTGGVHTPLILSSLMVQMRPYRRCFNGYFITLSDRNNYERSYSNYDSSTDPEGEIPDRKFPYAGGV